MQYSNIDIPKFPYNLLDYYLSPHLALQDTDAHLLGQHPGPFLSPRSPLSFRNEVRNLSSIYITIFLKQQASCLILLKLTCSALNGNAYFDNEKFQFTLPNTVINGENITGEAGI